MGLLRVTKFADLHIMDPRYALCEDTVEILQYLVLQYAVGGGRETLHSLDLDFGAQFHVDATTPYRAGKRQSSILSSSLMSR